MTREQFDARYRNVWAKMVKRGQYTNDPPQHPPHEKGATVGHFSAYGLARDEANRIRSAGMRRGAMVGITITKGFDRHLPDQTVAEWWITYTYTTRP